MMFELQRELEGNARIKVVGIGGAGGNAVNRMITMGLSGVDYIVMNTDGQVLEKSLAPTKVQIGSRLTKGLGTGGNPEIGRRAIEEDREVINELLKDSDMIFITAGMGGGTGTGAAPVVVEIARELGILCVAVVTKPFLVEGKPRMKNAEMGIEELKASHCDTLIVIPNQRILEMIDRKTPTNEAFLRADDILLYATKGIADMVKGVGVINIDFADVRTIMSQSGDALMGTGIGKGENKAMEAATMAIKNQLQDNVNITGAKGALVHVWGGVDLPMWDVNEALAVIQKEVGEDANIILGLVQDEAMGDEMRVTVIITGFGSGRRPAPVREAVSDYSHLRSAFGGMQAGLSAAPVEPTTMMAGTIGDDFMPTMEPVQEAKKEEEEDLSMVPACYRRQIIQKLPD